MKTKLIAEIGINHNGNINIAKKMIDAAYIAGFHYVKFQKRNPDLCVPEHQKNILKETPWGKITYLEYKHKIEFNMEQYNELFLYSISKNLIPFASVWDIESAINIHKITNIVKIPSALITNIPLLEKCKNLFDIRMISTGMSTEKEIDKAVNILKPTHIFHTNSSYPSPIEELNLSYIKHLKEKYNIITGFSSHYAIGIQPIVWSIFYGSEIVEVHITLDRTMWGSDQSSSIGLTGITKLVSTIKDAEVAIGNNNDRIVFKSELEKRKTLRG
jgi:N-acetylneuraminate synthase